MECKGDKFNRKERGSVGVFRRGKFELLALTETKFKGDGVNGITAGVQEIEMAGEGVAILVECCD